MRQFTTEPLIYLKITPGLFYAHTNFCQTPLYQKKAKNKSD